MRPAKIISVTFIVWIIGALFGAVSVPVARAAGPETLFFAGGEGRYQSVEVESVLGPSLLKLKGGEVISLIGIKGPQLKRRRTSVPRDEHGFPVEEETGPEAPVEERATEYVRKLLENEKVRLEFDVSKRRQDGKTQAYVFRVKDGLLINTEILRMGFAELSIEPPNTKYADLFRAAYREARQEQRGMLAD